MTGHFELNCLLLRAAFAPPAEALPAWQQWCTLSGWQEKIHPDAYLLLPRVYHNLRGESVEDELFSRLKGVVKRNWLFNSARLASVSAASTTLDKAQVDACLLPPVSLVLYQRSLALHKKATVCFRAPACQAHTVLKALLAAGWQGIDSNLPRWFLARYLKKRNKVALQHPRFSSLEVTWRENLRCYMNLEQRTLPGGDAVRCLAPAEEARYLLAEPGMGEPLRRTLYGLLLLDRTSDVDTRRLLLAHVQSAHEDYWQELPGLFATIGQADTISAWREKASSIAAQPEVGAK